MATCNARRTSRRSRGGRVTKETASWLVLSHELGHIGQYFEASGEAGRKERLEDWSAIEADSRPRHQNPICLEVGQPMRARYQHRTLGYAMILATHSKPTTQPAWKRASKRTTIETGLTTLAAANGIGKPETGGISSHTRVAVGWKAAAGSARGYGCASLSSGSPASQRARLPRNSS